MKADEGLEGQKENSIGSEEDPVLQFSVEELISSFNNEVLERLNAVDKKLEIAEAVCGSLQEKLDQCYSLLDAGTDVNPASPLPVNTNRSSSPPIGVGSTSITVITLNTIDDYPEGSWLGDENRPEIRVRCGISPTELFHINTTCKTAEKMALTLLDHLFDRDTQACSNISGTGKHKKRRLDPLLLYGIQCHLMTKFNITTEDWSRIKQNINSKCRTAFRNKMHSLSKVGASSNFYQESCGSDDGSAVTYRSILPSPDSIRNGFLVLNDSLQSKTSSSSEESFLAQILQQAEFIQTDAGEVQVFRATPEQVAQLQHTHQIRVLTSDQILDVSSSTDQTNKSDQ